MSDRRVAGQGKTKLLLVKRTPLSAAPKCENDKAQPLGIMALLLRLSVRQTSCFHQWIS